MRHRGLLRHIAMERVGAELDKIVGGADPARGVALVHRAELWKLTKTPLTLPRQLPDASHASADLRPLRLLNGADLRWAAIWLVAGVDEQAALEWMRGFGLGNKRLALIKAVAAIHRSLAGVSDPSRRAWTALVLSYGREAARAAVSLGRHVSAMTPASGVDWEQLEVWLAALPIDKVRDLAIDGNELAQLGGRKPGAWMRLLLEELLLAVAAGEIANEREPLRAEAVRRLQDQEEQR